MTKSESKIANTTEPTAGGLPGPLRDLLASLRSKIRWTILLETLAVVTLWVISAFAVAALLDYLPVPFGLDELPLWARAALLVVILLVTGWLLWRFLLTRIFVRFPDSTLALLLERKNPEFAESLITAVTENPDRTGDRTGDTPGDLDDAMMSSTRKRAELVAGRIDPDAVINWPRIRMLLIGAGVAVASLLAFAFTGPALSTAFNRIILLSDQPWPRVSRLEFVGVRIQRENPVEGIEETSRTILPDEGNVVRVGRGASATLLVRAAAATGSSGKIPETCTVYYQDSDGNRGRQPMKKVGAPRDGFQLFSIDGSPFDGIVRNVSLTVRGGDFRIGPIELRVVEWPVVEQTELDCVFPDYMVDENSGRWTPRTIPWTGRTELPTGTGLTIRGKSSKPLTRVYAGIRDSGKVLPIQSDGDTFSFPLPPLSEPQELVFYLCDSDGIVAEQPHAIMLEPVEDQPPTVRTSLTGIGTAITPDVRIPVSAIFDDDYGVATRWLQIDTPTTGPLNEKIDRTGAKIDFAVDFEERKQRQDGGFILPTAEGSQIRLRIAAEDAFNLPDSEGVPAESHIGTGDEYTLDVVTSGELLRILERQEVDQRRRLEQIRREVANARDFLYRSRSQIKNELDVVEPGDRDATPANDRIRKEELRLLFSRRSVMQIDKSTQEITGVANVFEHIRQQLINNRVDSEDRKNRLSLQIVEPLQLIADVSMKQWREEVTTLEEALEQIQSGSTAQQSQECDRFATRAITTADSVIAELDAVLSVLVKYETRNELLDIVRRMIEQQEAIAERTEKQRKKSTLDGLLDD